MPTFADIILANGANVSKTFKARSTAPGPNGIDRFTFKLEDGTTPLGYHAIVVHTQYPTKPTGHTRHEFKIVVPTVDQPASAPGVYQLPAKRVDSDEVTLSFSTSALSSVTAKSDLVAYARLLLAHSMMASMVVNGENLRA